MSDFVWISTAPGHASNMRGLTSDIAELSSEVAIPILKRIEAGDVLRAEEYPTEIFAEPHANEISPNMPDLFKGGIHWAVSESAASVLGGFSLGSGEIRPVKLLKKDRQTKIDGQWYCSNFGNKKASFIPEESKNIRKFARDIWAPPFVPSDGDIALSREALTGADLWVEPKLDSAFFVSGALGKALKKAKADKGFFLKKCRVIN